MHEIKGCRISLNQSNKAGKNMNSYNEHTDYKLTDLDYLTGDHHLQMMKAALPFLNVPQQRTLSMFVKIQELKNTFQLFEDGQTAAMGICSLDQPEKTGSVKELLKTLKPYGNPGEQNLIDAANALLDGQTPLEQLRHFLTPAQQTRFETLQMVIAALQAMN
jgi:hypothetical protein